VISRPFLDTSPTDDPKSAPRAKAIPAREAAIDVRGIMGALGHGTHADTLLPGLCERLGVTVDEMLSRGRTKQLAHARAIVCWALRQKGFSFPEIGRALGRDHTSVIPAVRKIERAAEANVGLWVELEKLVNHGE
jgi:chromosomal replication initiation ATPase DnaA